tara:strand:+ start:932 stop:1198 length:267 start_codon:yes stop_codon:yes gene_type:complete
MRVIFLVLLLCLVGCNNEEAKSKVPTGKGKVYGELNKRKQPCRFVKVERNEDMNAWQCVYDHPKSDIHDRVTVGESNMCPKMVYCDKR